MSIVFIGIGSNLGDRVANCKKAIDEISSIAKVVQISSLYETDPVGKEDQPEFINCVVEIETELSPQDLLKHLNRVEEELGRVRHEKWGPRIIDLDIIFYDDQVIIDQNLEIPHPRAHLRRFVIEPLCEIAPEFIHPKFSISVLELLNKIEDDKRVVRISDQFTIPQH